MNNNSQDVQRIIVPDLGRLETFVHATICGDTIYISGTIPIVGAEFKLIDGGMTEQTTQTLVNIEKILQACGAPWSSVAKLQVYIHNFDCDGDKDKAKEQSNEYNNAYKKFFEERKTEPVARITVGVKGLALGALIEIDGMAYLPKKSS